MIQVTAQLLMRWAFNSLAVVTYIALIALLIRAIRKWNPRYSVRTLFIITTAVSVGLGVVAYLLQK